MLCHLSDPALRRTVHVALPAGPLPAAQELHGLLQDAQTRIPHSHQAHLEPAGT